MQLNLLTPDRKIVVNQTVDEVIIPGFQGELGILPGHVALMTTMKTGIVRWKISGETNYHSAVVSWGYCEVNADQIQVLADVLDLPEEINAAVASEKISELEKKLGEKDLSPAEIKVVSRQLYRFRAQKDLVTH